MNTHFSSVRDSINPVYDLGNVKQGSQATAVFVRDTSEPYIKTIVPSCGCTSSGHSSDHKMLSLTLTAPTGIPEGVASQGLTSYPIEKTVEVYYTDDSYQVLTLKATVVQ